jgi:hypothetical protein
VEFGSDHEGMTIVHVRVMLGWFTRSTKRPDELVSVSETYGSSTFLMSARLVLTVCLSASHSSPVVLYRDSSYGDL